MRILGMDTPELIFIGFVCLLLFGANKLPELGKAVGVTIKEFKKAMRESSAEDETLPSVKPQK